MAEHKAKVILGYDVFKKIEWLTHNFDKEIGALGTVKIRTKNNKKHFYIEKLYFPKQTVTGATINISPSDMSALYKSIPKEDKEKLLFYWHRHPSGCASHSATDEEDTYETFMSDTSKRKFFVFMQTASIKEKLSMDIETRIDITNPVRATILKKDIEVKHEDPSWFKLKKECETIIKEVIKEKVYNTTVSSFNKLTDDKKTEIEKDNKKGLEDLFNSPDMNYIDNDRYKGIITSDEDKISMTFKHGIIILRLGSSSKLFFNELLKNDDFLKTHVNHYLTSRDYTMNIIKVQPKKKSFDKLKEKFLKLFQVYNEEIIKKENAEKKSSTEKCEVIKNSQGTVITNNIVAVNDILTKLSYISDINWNEAGTHGIVTFHQSNTSIGNIYGNTTQTYIRFSGTELESFVNDYIESMKEEGLI